MYHVPIRDFVGCWYSSRSVNELFDLPSSGKCANTCDVNWVIGNIGPGVCRRSTQKVMDVNGISELSFIRTDETRTEIGATVPISKST